MALETATYINTLNAANPTGSDPISSGDDHIRMVKAAIKATFPNITGPVLVTQDQINSGSGVGGLAYLSLTGGTMTGPLVLSGDPTTSAQAATKSYVDSKAGVSSFNTRTGAVNPQASDYSAFYASLSGATFSGNVLTSGQVGLTGTGLNYSRMVGSSIQLYDSASSIYGNQFGGVGILANSYNPLAMNGAGIGPGSDNAFSCGVSTYRWSAVYATNGTIQTSDARLKTQVTPSPLGLDFISKLNPVSYKWISGGKEEDGTTTPTQIGGETVGIKNFKDRPGVRTHYGLLAQEVKAVLDQEQVGDFAGWTLSDKNDPNSEQGLNYAQFIAPMIKAIQELKAELDTAKAEIVELKAKVGN